MPGVGICAPMRYTASSARVNNTLFRKSGMRKRFRNASMNLFITWPYFISLRYDLECATCLGDFLLGGRAECVRVNGDLCRELAIAQNLYALAAAPALRFRRPEKRSVLPGSARNTRR